MNSLAELRAALPAYPIEVPFPDISRWKSGNCGIDYVHSFDSGQPGPHVMVLSLIHGNEVSGAIAVDTLLAAGLRPRRGRLSFAFANVAAYQRFDPADGDAARFIDEDMNRVWSPEKLDGPLDSVELRRARELRPFMDTVDLLLDIHSMHETSAPLMMCGPLGKGIQLAASLGYPQHVIVDAGHANGRRLRDYGGFGDPNSPRNALLIETGQHFSLSGKRVALDTTARFLVHSGVVTALDVQAYLTEAEPDYQRYVQITEPVVARTMNFAFVESFTGLEMVPQKGTVIAYDGGRAVVTPYDNCIVIQPSLRQLAPGVTVMRLGRLISDGKFLRPAGDAS